MILLKSTIEKYHLRSALGQILERRVGREAIAVCLDSVSKSEHYVRAAQRPIPYAKAPTDLLIDYEFTNIFKSLEAELVHLVRPSGSSHHSQHHNLVNGGIAGVASPGQNDSVVASYKDLIKRQDEQISSLAQQVKRLEIDLDGQRRMAEEQNQLTVAQSRDDDNAAGRMSKEIARLQSDVEEKCKLLAEYQLKEEEEYRLKYKSATETATETASSAGGVDVAQLRAQLDQANLVCAQWQAEAVRYQQFAEQWQQYQIGQLPNPQDSVVAVLQQQLEQVEQQLSYGYQMYEQQGQEMVSVCAARADLETRANALQNQLNELNAKLVDTETARDRLNTTCQQLTNDLQNSQFQRVSERENAEARNDDAINLMMKEHDDLLLLLADQDSKVKEYRRRLTLYGETVTEDEDEVEDEDEEEEEQEEGGQENDYTGANDYEQQKDRHMVNGHPMTLTAGNHLSNV